MPKIEHFDSVFLGGGASAKNFAPYLAGNGDKTAIVERRWIGGSCPNVNCLPTKNEVWSAKVIDLARRGAQFGAVTGAVSVDMSRVRQRKQDMVDGFVELYGCNYRAAGVELLMGDGRFVAPKTIEVELNDGGSRILSGDKIFVNTGTSAAMPDIAGLPRAHPMTNIEALELESVPSHLIVLGGGYVGLELAQTFRRFGSQVTVVEHGRQIAAREDADVAAKIRRVLEREGIEILVATNVVEVEGVSGEGVSVTVESSDERRALSGSHILVAAGRRPNTANLGLENAGIRMSDRGFIEVNDRLETSAPNVWALGECAGSPQFTHVAIDDFRIVRDNLNGGARTSKWRQIPYCMFTDPPLARIGLGEDEARARGIAVRVAKLPMGLVGRTRTLDETEGFMKAIVAAENDSILGFVMVGPEAGEVVAVVQMAMLGGLPFSAVRDAIITHPTMAEGLGPLLSRINGDASR